MHPKTAAHETALVTNLTCAITAVEVNQRIKHPISFGPILIEMNLYKTTYAPNLCHFLDKLEAYLKIFYERTRNASKQSPLHVMGNYANA